MRAEDEGPEPQSENLELSRRHMLVLAGLLGVAAAGASQVFAEGASAAPGGYNVPFTAPYPGITSPYGYRWHPVRNEWAMHYGTDYGMVTGRSIKAIAAGTVTQKGFVGTAGNMVTIAHPNGISSTYMHMQSPSPLAQGATVNAGDHVGPVGATGGVTGAHLHLEIRVNGSTVDPAVFLTGAPYAGDPSTTPPPPPPIGKKKMWLFFDQGGNGFLMTDSGVTGVGYDEYNLLWRVINSNQVTSPFNSGGAKPEVFTAGEIAIIHAAVKRTLLP